VQDGLGSGDCNGHGTHVAGTIGSKTFGVAKKTTLIPVRVLDCAGSGLYSSVIAGLNWIAGNYIPGEPAVVNMSLGGPASSTLDEAVNNLISKGLSVVVAAGNDNLNACDYSPARTPDAITVGATNTDDSRASYSNFGSCLDIFAPGTSIPSTWLGVNYYAILSGTSMAAPHVAGVIVRFLAQYPGLSPAQVTKSIKTSSTKNLVTSGGTGSPNRLVYLTVLPDTTNVALSVAGSTQTVASRQLLTISAVSNVAGKVTFRANGKVIPGCKGVRTVSLTATCPWRSSVKGTNQLSAQIIPTEIAENEVATSSNYSITVTPRTGPRN
jgi:subtilisin family serine protease